MRYRNSQVSAVTLGPAFGLYYLINFPEGIRVGMDYAIRSMKTFWEYPLREKTRNHSLMAELWEYLKNMFRNQEKMPAGQPYLHHLMETDEEEDRQFKEWKGSKAKSSLIRWLQRQVLAWQSATMQLDEAIDFLDTPSAKGFVIHLEYIDFDFLEMKHLMDHLKERVLDLNYRKYLSDVRSYRRAEWHETVYRHYLKPPFMMDKEGRFNQLFGNIHIEFTLRDDEPHHFKFSVLTKKDRLYHSAQTYEKLLEAILV